MIRVIHVVPKLNLCVLCMRTTCMTMLRHESSDVYSYYMFALFPVIRVSSNIKTNHSQGIVGLQLILSDFIMH